MSANVKFLLCGFNPEKRLQDIALAKAATLRPCLRLSSRQGICALPRSRQNDNLEVIYAARWYELRGICYASQFTSH
ncbi:hypothetical protein VU08_06560 [Desulfobulbus sp. F5]|nr:hypothetical protein [Desulfobulbus sp. F5]